MSTGSERTLSTTRRWFLAATTIPATAASTSRVIGANDRINVGSIGVGGMGTAHVKGLTRQFQEAKDVQVVAVCDVYDRYKERARAAAGLAEKDVHHDYRDLLVRNDVDAVFIASPDHWHARMALDAMAAGKDVYLQKPMTYTIDEARALVKAAAKHQRILQVGSQHASDPRNEVARKLIADGAIGELLWATATASRNSAVGEWNYYVDEGASPETIDWKRWLGPATKRPFSAERYFRWRKYWDYSGGIATDLYYHTLNPLLIAVGAQFPVAVTGSGGIYAQKDREVPDTYATVIEYPNFYINLSGSMASAAGVKYYPRVIYGHKGTILYEKDKVIVVPEHPELRHAPRKTANPLTDAKTWETEPVPNMHRLHTDNFFECMRSRKQPNLHPELGYKTMVAIRLGVDSYRKRKAMAFDPRLEKVVKGARPRPAFEGDGQNYPMGYKKRT